MESQGILFTLTEDIYPHLQYTTTVFYSNNTHSNKLTLLFVLRRLVRQGLGGGGVGGSEGAAGAGEGAVVVLGWVFSFSDSLLGLLNLLLCDAEGVGV